MAKRHPKVPGSFQQEPPRLVRDLSPGATKVAEMLRAAGALHAELWQMGKCEIIVGREPNVLGTPQQGIEYRWHMSITHPDRYPTWDEIKAAAFGIECLQGVMLAQVFTPGDGTDWVDLHPNAFHLYEIRDEALR